MKHLALTVLGSLALVACTAATHTPPPVSGVAPATAPGTPDAGRRCEANKAWRFAVTQNRPWWRLREFEWSDGLTDYVDIYF